MAALNAAIDVFLPANQNRLVAPKPPPKSIKTKSSLKKTKKLLLRDVEAVKRPLAKNQ